MRDEIDSDGYVLAGARMDELVVAYCVRAEHPDVSGSSDSCCVLGLFATVALVENNDVII